jgi:hypothetical protein
MEAQLKFELILPFGYNKASALFNISSEVLKSLLGLIILEAE